MEIKESTITIRKYMVDEINRLLALEPSDTCIDDAGYAEDDDAIFYFQAVYDDECQVDIRVCSGNQNFYLDVILYDENGNDWRAIENAGNIDRDFVFDVDYDENENPTKQYIVHIKVK